MAAICRTLQHRQCLVQTLEAIAQAVARCLGFGVVAVVVREHDRWSISAAAGGAMAREKLADARKEWTYFVDLLQGRPRISRSCLVQLDCGQQGQDVLPSNQDRSLERERMQEPWNPTTVLLTPIYWNEEMVGVLWVDEPDDGMAPDVNTVRILEVFADQAALAIYQRRLLTELEASRRALDSFASCLPFQLKTPLTTVRGYAELLAQLYGQGLDAEGCAIVRNIEAAVDQIVAILDALLADSARDPLGSFVSIDINRTITALLGRFLRDIHKRGARIDVASNLPNVYGTPLGVQQVFFELIDNALKYAGQRNRAPRVTIDGTIAGDLAHFRVQDNGLGFTPEQLERAFEGFVRFHPDESPGVGLGLAIARLMVEEMGGTIWAESSGPGQGATFHVMLPTARGAVPHGQKLSFWQRASTSDYGG
jgi:signal transduction histidine kinase